MFSPRLCSKLINVVSLAVWLRDAVMLVAYMYGCSIFSRFVNCLPVETRSSVPVSVHFSYCHSSHYVHSH